MYYIRGVYVLGAGTEGEIVRLVGKLPSSTTRWSGYVVDLT